MTPKCLLHFSEGPFRDSGGAPVVQVSGGGQGEHAQLPRAGTGNHLQVQCISDKMISFREVQGDPEGPGLGYVDSDFGSSLGWWAATIAA